MSVFGIIKSLSKRAWDAVGTSITAIRWLKKLRAYLRFVALTVFSALGAGNMADSFGAYRCRAFGGVLKYTFIPELAFASGRLAFTACMSLYLTTDCSTAFTGSFSDPGKTMTKCKRSLDK